jgi:hypothetical protein
MNEYKEPGRTQNNDQSKTRAPNEAGTGLENKGPNKAKNPKVLHKDGSLADLPYNNQPGGGALEGTVGIGT